MHTLSITNRSMSDCTNWPQRWATCHGSEIAPASSLTWYTSNSERLFFFSFAESDLRFQVQLRYGTPPPQQIHFPPVRWLFKDIEIDWSISKLPNLGKVAAANDSVSIRKMSGNEIFFSSQDENPFCGRFLGAYWQLKAILVTSANAQLLQISANGRSSRTVDLWMIFNGLDRQMNS